MTDQVTIRRATADDLDEITRIYDQYIVGSHVSFDTEPWSRRRRLDWWEERQSHPRLVVMVADDAERVVGVAYSSWYRPKDGYRRTVETTIVLDPDRIGEGLGTRLYATLLDAVAEAGTHRAYAVVALPNDASVALHHKLGFVRRGGRVRLEARSVLTLEKRF